MGTKERVVGIQLNYGPVFRVPAAMGRHQKTHNCAGAGVKTVILLCTRIESSRLPGKALLTVEGISLLEHIILRVKPSDLPIFLLVPVGQMHHFIYLQFMHNNVHVLEGNPESPLHRMADFMRQHNEYDLACRLTHDDPLIDIRTMADIIGAVEREGSGYGISPGIVEGAGVEIIHRENLIAAAERRKEPIEYVSYFVRGEGMPKPGITKVEPRLSVKRTQYRFTVDYPEDLLALKVVLRAVGPSASLDTFVRYVDQRPHVLAINRQPDVTFYTCARNAESWIGDTIRSVLHAGIPNMEYVLVDDGSTDKTLEVMAQFAGDPRVKLVVNDSNIGLASSSNIALSKARGKIVVRVDADDLLIAGQFAAEWPGLRARIMAGEAIIYPAYDEVNEYGGIESEHLGSGGGAGCDPRRYHHAGCAIMDRAFVNELRFRNGLRHWDSLDLYQRASKAGKIGYLDVPIWQYRRHIGQMSTHSPEREAAKP